jgi:hypothetical protein
MQSIRTFPLIIISFALTVCLVALMSVIYLTHSLFIDFIHTSDATGCYYVYKEMFVNNVNFKDIYTVKGHSSISIPYFLYAIAAFIAENFYYAQLLNAIIQSIIFLIVGFYVFLVVYKKTDALYLFIFLILSLGLALILMPSTSGIAPPKGFYPWPLRSFYYPIWMPDYHFVQTCILGLLSFIFFVQYLNTKNKKIKLFFIVVFVILSLIGGSGNDLFLLYSTLPIILMVIYLYFINKIKIKEFYLWILVSILVIIMQKIIGHRITITANVLTNYTEFSPTYIKNNVKLIISMFFGNFIVQPFLVGGFLLLAFYGLWNLVAKFNQYRSNQILETRSLFLILFFISILCVLGAEVFSKMVRERYVSSLLFYSMVIFLVYFGNYLFTKSIFFKASLVIFVFIFFMSQFYFFSHKKIKTNYYPKEIQCIDNILYRLNKKNGIAPYRIAHRTEMISKNNITVVPTKDYQVYKFFISKKDLKKKFSFILSSNEKYDDHWHMKKDNMIKFYGEPNKKIECGAINIYTYEKPFNAIIPK